MQRRRRKSRKRTPETGDAPIPFNAGGGGATIAADTSNSATILPSDTVTTTALPTDATSNGAIISPDKRKSGATSNILPDELPAAIIAVQKYFRDAEQGVIGIIKNVVTQAAIIESVIICAVTNETPTSQACC
jgi:hypothetical protein